MDIHSIQITPSDLEMVRDEVTPASPAGEVSFTGEACVVYQKARPFLKILAGVVKWIPFVPPPTSAALEAAMAILDRACKE